jgi:alkyl hydroperoxide reductase subunit AhpC
MITNVPPVHCHWYWEQVEDVVMTHANLALVLDRTNALHVMMDLVFPPQISAFNAMYLVEPVVDQMTTNASPVTLLEDI